MLTRYTSYRFLFFSIGLLISSFAYAQAGDKQLIEPILIDKSALSGVGLRKVKLPNEPNRAFFQKNVYRGTDISVYVISSETASTNFQPMPFDEFIYLLNGRAHISPDGKDDYYFNSGDFIIAPRGYRGKWEVIGGHKYHLELSVITNARSTENTTDLKIPTAIDPSLLSGTSIETMDSDGKKEYLPQQVLKGSELHIWIQAEPIQQKVIKYQENETFIHVLAGMVAIQPAKGEVQIFYPGDFFILPKGFTGIWESKGKHLFRSLRIEKAW